MIPISMFRRSTILLAILVLSGAAFLLFAGSHSFFSGNNVRQEGNVFALSSQPNSSAETFLLAAASSAGIRFERNLYFGMRADPDVVKLQEFLRRQGYFSYPFSNGNYFGVTTDAVRRFQKDRGVPVVGGYFGPQSREVANRIIAQQTPRSAVAPPPSSPPPSSVPQTSPLPDNQSLYKGKVTINSVSGNSSKPESEYITIVNQTQKESVNITGFRIQNSLGREFVIPRGQELPGFNDSFDDPITLKPGDTVRITMGKQERHLNFRENLCTGYFDELSDFNPSLSHACPRPDSHQLLGLSDRCLAALDSIGICRIPQQSQLVDSECSEYMSEHFNYVGCVRDFRSRTDFYSRQWLVWMQRDQEFFRNVHEKIVLLDQDRKVVDQYSY